MRHVGLLEMSEFYRWLKRWLEFKGYWANSNEKLYSETITPNGKKIDIQWMCKKEATSYFINHIDIIFLFIGVNKIEIPQGEQKVKIEKGDFEIRINGYLEKAGEGTVASLHEELKAIFDQYVQ